MNRTTIDKCLRQSIIPMVWDPAKHESLVDRASMALLQRAARRIAEIWRLNHQ